jgi:hypothetical protein
MNNEVTYFHTGGQEVWWVSYTCCETTKTVQIFPETFYSTARTPKIDGPSGSGELNCPALQIQHLSHCPESRYWHCLQILRLHFLFTYSVMFSVAFFIKPISAPVSLFTFLYTTISPGCKPQWHNTRWNTVKLFSCKILYRVGGTCWGITDSAT